MVFYVVLEMDYIYLVGIGMNRDRFVWYCRILWSKLSNIGKFLVFYLVLFFDELVDIEDWIILCCKINYEYDVNGWDFIEFKWLL